VSAQHMRYLVWVAQLGQYQVCLRNLDRMSCVCNSIISNAVTALLDPVNWPTISLNRKPEQSGTQQSSGSTPLLQMFHTVWAFARTTWCSTHPGTHGCPPTVATNNSRCL
jgi:hypothetical protein